MKRYVKYLLTLYVCLICNLAIAQLKLGEPVLVSVHYQFVYVDDLNQKDKPITERMMLQVGQTTSKYRKASFPKSIASEKPIRPSTVRLAGDPNLGTALAVIFGPGFTTEELYQFPNEQKVSILDTKGMYDYQIDMNMPKIDWKIFEETKNIGIYTCQKAVGEYSGRTYTAWFTPELPFKTGPWKLSGLPGLILEASDSKNEVMFLFKTCTKQVDNARIATFKERLIKVDQKAYQRLKAAFEKDPVNTFRGQFSSGKDRNIEIAYRDSTGLFIQGGEAEEIIAQMKKAAKLKKYNPIELK